MKEILEKKLKTVKIKWKDYVEVKERILALAENTKYSIETNYEYFNERKMWVVKAKLTLLDTWETYTWLSQEIESDDYKQVNFSSALENAETSAVWRACAMAGIGVINWIASSDEVNKAVNRWSWFTQEKWEKHICKKCWVLNENAVIKQWKYWPYFVCSDCWWFSNSNPYYEEWADNSEPPAWDTSHPLNK